MNPVRTRFAPSPTGTLHVGNARTAVINWLMAQHHGGEFVLRIEDTDEERNVEGAEQRLMADLRWLGLDWDEGPDPDGGERGDRGPYRQRRRLPLYHGFAGRLVRTGAAYRCFCDPETLEADRREALDEGRSPLYTGRCRTLAHDEALRRADGGEPHVIRLAIPSGGTIDVDDRIRGRVTFDAANLGDFVLLRSDGLPTYNFAVVVDDVEMAITHVIRDAGHLSNTPLQLLVYRALGFDPPTFAHTPTVLGDDRAKLSKRSGAPSLAGLRDQGFHPDGVLNYLSLLGWSSPSGDEILSRDRLVEEVTLERMNAADVVFDLEKLRWVSGKHIEAMSLDDLAKTVRPIVDDSPFADLAGPALATALDAVRSHLRTFGEVTDHLAPFHPPTAHAKAPPEGADQVLHAVRMELAALEVWEAPAIQKALKAGGTRAGVRGKDLYIPVRQALTGQDHGPPLAAVIDVQGRDPVLGRLDAIVTGAEGLTPKPDRL